MNIEENVKLDFDNVLIKPKRSKLASRKDVNLARIFRTQRGLHIEGIPIIAANMSTGNFKMADVFAQNKMFVAIAKHHNDKWFEIAKEAQTKNTDELEKYLNNCFYTIGMCDDELKRLIEFNNIVYSLTGSQKYVKICVDIANGYSQKFADFIRKIRDNLPDNVLMAGNVCTPEMTQELIIAGADIVKIGIGPGSACTTRKKTGVGYPQISAAIENADVAHGLSACICLDGGMVYPGDIAKAFGANADFVMIGGMFAGTDECDGELITKYLHDGTYNRTEIPIHTNGQFYHYDPNIVEKKYKKWFGMSSNYAQEQFFGGAKEYRTSEGDETEVEYIGQVQNVINDILGGLRSACTYVGSASLKDLGKCCSFIRVTKQHNKF